MNDLQAKIWMQKVAGDAAPLETPSFETIRARARLEAALQGRAEADSQLAWIEAAWQSLALCGLALLSIWLGGQMT